MKNYEVSIFFPNSEAGQVRVHAVQLQASSPQTALNLATKPAWYDLGEGLFMRASAITEVFVVEIKAAA